jgi:N-acetyl-gamma-glutamyl-phosphate reductase
VACPGCYPTSILLLLLPLIRKKLLNLGRILVTSLSGVTGAGRKVEAAYLFGECNESMRPYGIPKHRHLSEIEEQLSVFAGEKVTIQFAPHLIPLNRGIVTTIYVDLTQKIDADAITSIYENAYRDEPFVRLLGDTLFPDTKNVAGTNFIDIAWRLDARTNRLILMSAIDNLLKGASGQAIQCFNVMRGYSETMGLL